MMTIKELLKDTHKRARHHLDSVIIDVIFQNGDPVVKRRECTCIVLSQALIKNISNMLFKDFNEPMLRLVFEELAKVPSSDVVKNRDAFAAVTDRGRVVSWGDVEGGGDKIGRAHV